MTDPAQQKQFQQLTLTIARIFLLNVFNQSNAYNLIL